MSVQQQIVQAREMLQDWIQAERAVMTGQEYRIGSRMLRRADLDMIAERVKYWKGEIDRLEGNPRIRTQQIIPRNL